MTDIDYLILGISIAMGLWAVSDYVYRHFIRARRSSTKKRDANNSQPKDF